MKTRKETTSSLLKKFSAYPSRFPFARGMVLWGILSLSLSTLLAQATGSDGIFGDYFTRMISDATSCGTSTVITGFNSTLGSSTYGTQECTTFQNIVKSVLGWSSAPAGQAVVGFNSTTGTPIYSNDVWPWHKNGSNIYYTGANVGIGTNTPTQKLDVNGNADISGNTYLNNVYLTGIVYDSTNSLYRLNLNGNTVFNHLYLSGVLYDQGNTAYYVNPSGTSVFNNGVFNGNMNLTGSIYIRGWFYDAQNPLYYMNLNGDSVVNRMFLYGNTYLSWVLYDQQNTWYFLNLNGDSVVNNVYLSGTLYDRSNAAYYTNPASTTNLNILKANALYLTGRLYDATNTGYYVDPSAKTNLKELCIEGVCKTGWDDPKKGDVLYGKILQFNDHNNYWDEKGSLANTQRWNDIIWYQAYDPNGRWKRGGAGQAASDWLWNSCHFDTSNLFPNNGGNPDAAQVINCWTAICEFYTGQDPFMSQLSNICAAGNPYCNSNKAYISWNCLTK